MAPDLALITAALAGTAFASQWTNVTREDGHIVTLGVGGINVEEPGVRYTPVHVIEAMLTDAEKYWTIVPVSDAAHTPAYHEVPLIEFAGF